jgi:hypothetical protein
MGLLPSDGSGRNLRHRLRGAKLAFFISYFCVLNIDRAIKWKLVAVASERCLGLGGTYRGRGMT